MKRYMVCFLTLMLVLWLPLMGKAQTGQLSTHILDISKGVPAQGVAINLFRYNDNTQEWGLISTHQTDDNGRVAGLLAEEDNKGIYKLHFATAPYFQALGQPSIYPYIEVVFQIEGSGHYHIPITLSANGYSTYRGN